MMEADFWQHKWANNEISFHKNHPNPLLTAHIKALSLVEGSVIFIPLCGKTLDIAWLLSKGYRVAGVELVEPAIEQLFTELAIVPKISIVGKIKHYQAKNIDIYVGDIFELSQDILHSIDAIYDRAALIALPEETRTRYTTHLMKITDKAPQLLIVCHYDQTLMQGPPFSINDEKISRLYKDSYKVTLIESTNIEGGIKGKYAAKDNVWLLTNNN